MINIIILNKTDIEHAIAASCNVEPSRVCVEISSETVGYGMDEHEEPCVNATITVDNPKFSWRE